MPLLNVSLFAEKMIQVSENTVAHPMVDARQLSQLWFHSSSVDYDDESVCKCHHWSYSSEQRLLDTIAYRDEKNLQSWNHISAITRSGSRTSLLKWLTCIILSLSPSMYFHLQSNRESKHEKPGKLHAKSIWSTFPRRIFYLYLHLYIPCSMYGCILLIYLIYWSRLPVKARHSAVTFETELGCLSTIHLGWS